MRTIDSVHMVNIFMDNKQPASPSDTTTGIAAPLSVEDLRKDAANVFLLHLRTIAWMTDVETAESIVCGLAEDHDRHPLMWQADAEDIGLTYERIKETALMRTLERLYRYAYFGELDGGAEPMSDESIYTWISALVFDAAHGRLADEWADNGSMSMQAAARCLTVCELANARHTLEGGEPFYFKFGSVKDTNAEGGCLTIRQMALLAGMEEMSIRAAANKTQKRANPLLTYSTEGGTRVALDTAREWLQSKGRYVPVRVRWSDTELDLKKTRFSNENELYSALKARFDCRFADLGHEQAAQALENIGLESLLGFSGDRLNDRPLVLKLAELLDMPAELFALRCREVAAREELARIEELLKRANDAFDSTVHP